MRNEDLPDFRAAGRPRSCVRVALRGAHSHAPHLAPSIGVGAHRDDHRDRDDTPILTDFDIGAPWESLQPCTLIPRDHGAVPFKRSLYEAVLSEFATLLRS